MMITTTLAQMLVRITGLIQIVLGVLFWTGNALNLVPVHLISGLLMVLGLWVLAVTASLAGVGVWQVVLAIVWGFLTLLLGYWQVDLVPGSSHWLIQALHLLIGLAAIGQAETLASRIRRAMIRPA